MGKEGFFPEKVGMASILSCHAGNPFQVFQILFASMATGNVFFQKPSLPASHQIKVVQNQSGFKSSAGIHSALLSSFPFFRLDAGLLRNAGRKSIPHSEEKMPAGWLEKVGEPGRIQKRSGPKILKEGKPATLSARRNDTPSPRKSKEPGRENRDSKLAAR
jgi:hypothetical protein